jgi:hypothetical protein
MTNADANVDKESLLHISVSPFYSQGNTNTCLTPSLELENIALDVLNFKKYDTKQF